MKPPKPVPILFKIRRRFEHAYYAKRLQLAVCLFKRLTVCPPLRDLRRIVQAWLYLFATNQTKPLRIDLFWDRKQVR